MLVKLAGITFILANLVGCCAGGLKLEEPCDPFANYNCSTCKMQAYSYGGACYQTRSKFLDQ